MTVDRTSNDLTHPCSRPRKKGRDPTPFTPPDTHSYNRHPAAMRWHA